MNTIKNQALQLLNNLTPSQFLAEYWQKKPLLIKNAIPNFTGLLSPEELAGLACEEDVQARIVQKKADKWLVKNGPFDDADFTKLPNKDLARRGSRVLATDISPEMVKIAQAKLITAGLNATAEAVLGDITQLERMAVPNPGFDLIWSNFGGLNCLSPTDLRKLNDDLCRIISPQGTLIAIVMGRFCLWETVCFLLKGKPRQAFRRLKKEAVTAPTGAPDSFVNTWYYTPAEMQKLFPNFTITHLQPVGFWLPPSYLDSFFQRFPRFLRVLNLLERHISRSWMAWGADHFYVRLVV